MGSFLIVSVLAVAGPAFEIRTLGGDLLVGTIQELTADRLTVETADGPVSLETGTVVAVASAGPADRAPPSPAVWVELADGSRLACADYSAAAGRARITSSGGQPMDVSTRDVVAVRLQPPAGSVSAEWSRILELDAQSDLLVVRKGPSLDYHQGVLGDVTDTVVEFELAGDVLAVKREKVYGLVYYQSAGRGLADAFCEIAEADGSHWTARSIRLEGQQLVWSTPLGLEVTRPASEVLRIDFSQGKIVYLSDLEPESVAWTPYFGTGDELPAVARFFAPREDRGLGPGPLELDGRQYQKGLALHSRASLVYRLPGNFRRFRATAGIDDRVRPNGNVRLVIRGDRRVLLETAITGTDPPRPVDLDLTGVRRLSIVVDYGEDLDVADHLDLCEARLVK